MRLMRKRGMEFASMSRRMTRTEKASMQMQTLQGRTRRMYAARAYKFDPAFTLMELLIVIAIISLLAAMLLPALGNARERARQANCTGNLRQFSQAIQMYMDDWDRQYPPWLSTLYPSYLSSEKTYICLSDPTGGAEGGRADWCEEFNETDDFIDADLHGGNNGTVPGNSYFYEFAIAACSWFESSYNPGDQEFEDADTNGDDTITWCEAKAWQMEYQGYHGRVPIVRCFWHAGEPALDDSDRVLNIASEDFDVYSSGPAWEDSY